METSGHDNVDAEPAGWYHAEGDPPDTMRYWNGSEWVGGPVVSPSDAGTGAAIYPTDVALVTPGARMGAWIIDWVIIVILYLLIVVIGAGGELSDWFTQVQDAMNTGEQPPDPDIAISSWVFYATSALPFLWSAIWIAAAGATPGKFMVGARVADGKASVWRRATPLQAVLRSSNRLLSLLGFISASLSNLGTLALLGIFVVSLILLFTDDMHRTVMDRVANTLVVKSDVMGQTRPGYSETPTTT